MLTRREDLPRLMYIKQYIEMFLLKHMFVWYICARFISVFQKKKKEKKGRIYKRQAITKVKRTDKGKVSHDLKSYHFTFAYVHISVRRPALYTTH